MPSTASSTVPKGFYIYFLDGKPTDILETWQLEPAPGGEHIRSERIAYGTSLRLDAVKQAESITRFEVHYTAAGQDVSAQYEICGGQVNVRRSLNGVCRETSLALDEPFLVFPLLRVFAGPVILRLAQTGQPQSVLLPWLLDPANEEKFLAPHTDLRAARRVQQGSPNSAFSYTGEHYDETARFWVNEQTGLLSAYEWQQGKQHWQVRCQTNEQ